MIDVGFDFTGRHVLVTGGTRGLGLAMAQAFAATGARVSVTGTKILPSLYDVDLSDYDYHQLQLSNDDAIESFAAKIGAVDVLVNAAGAHLSNTMEEHEREFLSHSARLGLVGPQRLTQRLRQRICASPGPAGGAVVHTSPSLAWLELTQKPADAENELRTQTAQAGRSWSRLGARVNAVLSQARLSVPAQSRVIAMTSDASIGTLMTRTRAAQEVAHDQSASIALFLASTGAAAVSGQTFYATPHR